MNLKNIKELNKKNFEFDECTKIQIILLIFVLSGIFGFIYEELFYRIDLGYFVKRGTTFGPWIPIYGFGGIFILNFANRFRKNTIQVFLLSGIISGILEFLTGYVLYNFLNMRLWDYNTEIWNFGNIGGYICLRSILFFAFSGIFLIYFIYPLIQEFASMCDKKRFKLISIIPAIIFILDIIISAKMKLI